MSGKPMCSENEALWNAPFVLNSCQRSLPGRGGHQHTPEGEWTQRVPRKFRVKRPEPRMLERFRRKRSPCRMGRGREVASGSFEGQEGDGAEEKVKKGNRQRGDIVASKEAAPGERGCVYTAPRNRGVHWAAPPPRTRQAASFSAPGGSQMTLFATRTRPVLAVLDGPAGIRSASSGGGLSEPPPPPRKPSRTETRIQKMKCGRCGELEGPGAWSSAGRASRAAVETMQPSDAQAPAALLLSHSPMWLPLMIQNSCRNTSHRVYFSASGKAGETRPQLTV
ncbi:uncharacterized protein LOC119058480 [Artibeus jamaicensis]|uniref:uncharacterized protein LOC119058480 n=1 Tax=Artibeus jamaicensis TaxID=9417 RepID=UPI00235AB24F|nr:uncharacterized protein LOC119058480 [Artibeus jamaicensis]